MTRYTLKSSIEIVMEECIECGAMFGMTATMHQYKKDNKKNFFCPNGHSMSYTKSEVERLRDIIADKDRSLAYFRRIEQERSDKIKNALAAKKAKREAKKTK